VVHKLHLQDEEDRWSKVAHITEISVEIEVSYKNLMKTIEKHDFKSINSSETSCKYHNQMIRD
jgi:hypothetical protein